MNLPTELTVALIALGLAVITGLTEIVRRYVKVILTRLEHNTKVTEEVRTQTNGTLAKARDDYQRVSLERDAYRDIVRFVKARPDGAAILAEYAERRRVRVADAELDRIIASGQEHRP